MNDLLEEIFKTKKFRNSRNEVVDVHSETSKAQCEFLQRLVRENNFVNTLEIGFAFGMSTLAIVEEVAKRKGHHTVIDKYEIISWGSNGLDLVRQAGYEKDITFIEEFCYAALPKLIEAGKRFDFAYIDTTKLLDWILLSDQLVQLKPALAVEVDIHRDVDMRPGRAVAGAGDRAVDIGDRIDRQFDR